MKASRFTRWAAAASAAFTLTATLRAAPPYDSGARRIEIRDRLRALDVNAAQKAQIKQILQGARTVTEPLVRRAIAEHRALRDQIHRTPVDEAAIRAQAARLAAARSDLAVQRAKIYERVSAILTPVQLEQLSGVREMFRDRVDEFLDRAAARWSQS